MAALVRMALAMSEVAALEDGVSDLFEVDLDEEDDSDACFDELKLLVGLCGGLLVGLERFLL